MTTAANPLIPIHIDQKSFDSMELRIDMVDEALKVAAGTIDPEEKRRNIEYAQKYFGDLKTTFNRVKRIHREAESRLPIPY